MKSGFVGIVGRPNVGKSTLINNIVGSKISIISDKASTTRNIIQGIYNEDDVQIVFVDTPGIHKAKSKLGKILNKEAYLTINDVDVLLFLTDATDKLGTGDKFIIDLLKSVDIPVILVLNKIDKIKKELLLPKIEEYKSLYDFSEIVPVSALKNNNTSHLIDTLKKYLPDEIRYFDDNSVTSSSNDFLISELVREKILELTYDEVPHSVTCLTEEVNYKDNVVSIRVLIIVDRDNLKGIIIGKNGQKLKEIGTKARIEIENLLKKKVFLDLYVKVIPKWKDREKILNDLGYNEYFK